MFNSVMELFTPKNAELVVSTAKFAIASLFIHNDFGKISWTINYIYLNPQGFTDPLILPESKSGAVSKALYMIQKGTVTLYVDDIPTVVKAGQMFCVVQGQKHLFFNSTDEKAVIVMQYPSLFRFRKNLTKSKPMETIAIKELDPLTSLPSVASS